MISIFRNNKIKISEAFEKRSKPKKYSQNVLIKDFVFNINVNDINLGEYIKNTYSDFFTNREASYVFNLYDFSRKIVVDKNSDEIYKYDFIRFFDTFFYYRYSKKESIIDVLLPKHYEYWEFENFFKIFISSISLKYNSLLIHASAIITEQGIVLFSGQSGAGKSTIASLSECEMIHDDNILISHLGEGVFELETIPFKIPYKKIKVRGKIKSFYRLFQDKNTFVKNVKTNKQLTHLIFGLWAFNHFENTDSDMYNEDVMKYCMEILPYLNVKELHFTKTKDFLELI